VLIEATDSVFPQFLKFFTSTLNGMMEEDATPLEDNMAMLSLDRPAQQPMIDHPQYPYAYPYPGHLSSSQQVSSTSSSNNNFIKPFKHVRFSYVTIRNYDITMGDNPAVTAGPPIQLDWVYEEIPLLPVREFEEFKLQRVGKYSYLYPGAENRVVTISPDFRMGILLRAGFTDWEISQTIRNVKKIQQQRTRTALTYPFYHVEYAVRSAGRKLQRSMGNSNNSSSEGQKSCTSRNKQHPLTTSQLQYHDDEMSTGTVLDDHSVYGTVVDDHSVYEELMITTSKDNLFYHR
jgi:hypothetical protein